MVRVTPTSAPASRARSRPRANATGARWRHGHPGFAERYRAIASRDARFDGQFVTAVASTGIYCRPSCPARTPRETGVAFFATSAAAHEAGYRACKRCLPEATPGSPEWDWRGDVAGRAMRLITDGVVDREGVGGLAARLGYSPRHLTRLLTAELGAGPLALARARRAQLARALIVGTPLPLADVAFAAGFGSVRQFTDTVREVFAVTPSELRARAAARGSGGGAAVHLADGGDGTTTAGPLVSVTLTLPVRAPFDAPGVFTYLAARAIAGVELADLDLAAGLLRFARTVALPHGPAVIDVTATRASGSSRAPGASPAEPVPWALSLRLALTSLADVAVGVARARRMLDLDSDPLAVDEALARDPRLAPLVAVTPGIRVPGTADPPELLVRTIVGQQISVAAARTHLGRLAAAVGEPVDTGVPGLDRLFPTPAAIAALLAQHDPSDPARPLRLPARQVDTVARVATALASGELALDLGDDPSALAARLEALPGLGPWTARYVAMRVTGTPDAWIPGDVALLAGARAAGVVPGDLPRPAAFRLLAAEADGWAPWRSYAAAHLWRAALEGAPAHPEPPRKDTP
ncbi:DNA-3-methyladenine glycosylase II [Microcella putealis]|uniref:DNA-3-methyladenine glycosylase II n=1 Tax=Microcella putealis TaxID=337005 RepID=A0A4Q7LNH7_9MICO|nr:DNA-3-methyladenine glycosylase II [Microcella putealis]TQM23405.1 DNA-3-methyladenine glycosylase II [Microcella putealis]